MIHYDVVYGGEGVDDVYLGHLNCVDQLLVPVDRVAFYHRSIHPKSDPDERM